MSSVNTQLDRFFEERDVVEPTHHIQIAVFLRSQSKETSSLLNELSIGARNAISEAIVLTLDHVQQIILGEAAARKQLEATVIQDDSIPF